MIYITPNFMSCMGKQETRFLKGIADGLGIEIDDGLGSGGPGRSYRKGISMSKLLQMFPDDETAREWFESAIWPNGPVCPKCSLGDNVRPSTHKSMPYRCARCRRHFSVKIGTVMERSKIGYQNWLLAIYQIVTNVKGISSMKIHRNLGIRQPTAWFMLHRLREAISSLARPDLMEGPAEVDEMYVGGKEKNKHADKKGNIKKVAVVGARDRKTGQVTAKPVPETTAARLCDFIEKHVEPNAMKYTDESRVYASLEHHETVNHGNGEYVRGDVHTNGIESFWALFKRGYYGIYHHMSPKHLHRYVDEFAGRLNNRFRDTIDMMKVVVKNAVGKRLTYSHLIS